MRPSIHLLVAQELVALTLALTYFVRIKHLNKIDQLTIFHAALNRLMLFQFNDFKLVILSNIFWRSLGWRYDFSIGWTTSFTLPILWRLSLRLFAIRFLWIDVFVLWWLVSGRLFRLLLIGVFNSLFTLLSMRHWLLLMSLYLRLFIMLAHFLILINIIFLIRLLIIIVCWAGYLDFWLFDWFFYCILTSLLGLLAATLILFTFLGYLNNFVFTKTAILFLCVFVLLIWPFC